MAKRFRFRLEPVLRIRRQEADQAKRVVADTLRGISKTQSEIGLLQDRIDQQVAAMRAGPLVGALDVGQVSRHRHWLSHLQRGLLDATARVRQLQAHLAGQRAQLAEATKKVKILETLRRKQELRYHNQLQRREALEADEMSTQRYLRLRTVEA